MCDIVDKCSLFKRVCVRVCVCNVFVTARLFWSSCFVDMQCVCLCVPMYRYVCMCASISNRMYGCVIDLLSSPYPAHLNLTYLEGAWCVTYVTCNYTASHALVVPPKPRRMRGTSAAFVCWWTVDSNCFAYVCLICGSVYHVSCVGDTECQSAQWLLPTLRRYWRKTPELHQRRW